MTGGDELHCSSSKVVFCSLSASSETSDSRVEMFLQAEWKVWSGLICVGDDRLGMGKIEDLPSPLPANNLHQAFGPQIGFNILCSWPLTHIRNTAFIYPLPREALYHLLQREGPPKSPWVEKAEWPLRSRCLLGLKYVEYMHERLSINISHGHWGCWGCCCHWFLYLMEGVFSVFYDVALV